MFVWAAILYRWRLGVYALVVYTPFTGLVVAAFAPSPIGNLVRDFAIIIPLYIAFFLTRRSNDQVVMPFGFVTILAAFTLLIVLSAGLSETAGTTVALLGAKVWLFYIPLAFVASAFIHDRGDLEALLRTFVVMGWIPCVVGLLMWIGAINYDYKESIELVYGEYARNATQNFAAFQIGQSKIYRIPATFQFATQYATFAMFMIIPALMQARLDQSRNWRIFGYLSLMLFIAASLTSGSRGAFLHVPFLLALVGGLRFGFSRGGNALVVFAFVVFGGVMLSQFDESAIIDHVAELAAANGQYIVLGGLSFAIENGGMLGKGVGIATVATRHVIEQTDLQLAAIENYYAKAWMELGIAGFAILILLLVYLAVSGIRWAGSIRDALLRDTALTIVAMVLFTMYLSARGWPLDQDPLAYYFWMMVGVMMKMPALDVARRVARPASYGVGRTLGSQLPVSRFGQQ